MNRTTANLDFIKRVNRSLVLEKIRKDQPISRAKIAKELQLSRSTVSSIVENLLSKKLVVELGLGDSTKDGGRRGVELGFNPKSSFGIGVDIGGTKILIVITDLNGEILFRRKLETTKQVSRIVKMIDECMAEAGISNSDVFGMGVGVPGVTNIEKGIVIDAPSLNWENLELRKELNHYFPFPIFINNDVNCAALGERWLGSGDNSDHIFFIAIGTGVGSAIISDGTLVKGHSFQAGEIGYTIYKNDFINHKKNRLGEFGVLEKKISGSGLSSLGEPSEQLFLKYKNRNQEVIPIIEDFILELSITIANVVSLLNPEKVLIGGGVSESMDEIVDLVNDKVKLLTPIQTTVQLAKLGGDAGGLGAVAYAFQEVEQMNNL